jgi:CBS domain-containing protein
MIASLASTLQSISELTLQSDAIRVMLDGNHQRLAVVNKEGQLVGLLAKRTLLRSLAQLSV